MRLIERSHRELDSVVLDTWLEHLDDGPLSSNIPAQGLPYQRWYRFKEAFSPRFVSSLVQRLGFVPHRICDPFAGSGTTALTCRFLGIESVSIEVNPFLVDLVKSKVLTTDTDQFRVARQRVMRKARTTTASTIDFPSDAPPTLVQSPENNRWIFDRAVARRIWAYSRAIAEEHDDQVKRSFRVALGSLLIPCSNVVISGKGRRYRSNWRLRDIEPLRVDKLFKELTRAMLEDLCRYPFPLASHRVLTGDAREKLSEESEPFDLFLFSPPYPNSFDYTDIYNVELWTLGYLRDSLENRALRNATLRSHVQIKRDYANESIASRTLETALRSLRRKRKALWSSDLPNMVHAYFCDLKRVLVLSKNNLTPKGRIATVVGNSSYKGINIDVATILEEIAPSLGLRLCERSTIRSMRASAQQGGRRNLAESFLMFARR